MSSFPIHDLTAAWAPRRAAASGRLRDLRGRRAHPETPGAGGGEAGLELGFRFAAMRVGYWLGWASIVVVLAGLALDVGARHRLLLVASTLAAAAGNTVAMVIPWRDWLASRRGRVL